MRGSTRERGHARIDERARSERELATEPREVDEVASPGVRDVAGQRERVQLLRDMLRDGVDRELRTHETKALQDGIGSMGFELADDDVAGTDVNLELHQWGAGKPADHGEAEAAAGRSLEGRRGGRDVVGEAVLKVHGEPGRQERGRRVDLSFDPEVQVLRGSRTDRTPELVRVAALDDPRPRSGPVEEPREQAVDRDHKMNAPRGHSGSPCLSVHPGEEAGPAGFRASSVGRIHRPARLKSRCSLRRAMSSFVSIARAFASRAASRS